MTARGRLRIELGKAIKHHPGPWWRMHGEKSDGDLVHACTCDGVLHRAVHGSLDGWDWSVNTVTEPAQVAAGSSETAADALRQAGGAVS